MASVKSVTLPLIPLARDAVLLPGIVLRVPVASNRSDVPALLSSVYSRAASKTAGQRLDNVNVVCVPFNAPLLTPNGQRMISQDEQSPDQNKRPVVDPSSATREDLFEYGVAARISGVEGRFGHGEFALLVEGIARVRIDRFVQDRPFFEAEVTYEHDAGKDISRIMDSYTC
jgi:ATP-dependent Lon protease